MASNLQRAKTIMMNNWQMKIFAGIVAILTFYSLQSANNQRTEYSVPVEIILGPGRAILSPPKSVKVTFQGSYDDLGRLDEKLLKAVIHPKLKKTSGFERVPVRAKDIDKPSSVKIVNVEPDTVDLEFDSELKKTVEIHKPMTEGTPMRGKVDIEYEPRVVSILGPKSIVDKIVAMETEVIDVEGRGASFSKRVKVLSEHTEVTQIDPSEVSVTVNISTESVNKDFTNILVMATIKQGTARDITFEPAYVKVTLNGGKDILKNIESKDIKVFVDCASLDPSKSHKENVNIHLLQSTDVATSAEPSKVKVIFKKKPKLKKIQEVPKK